MRRACYCRKPNGFQILHLKSVRKDGYVQTERIQDIGDKTYQSLESAILEINSLGYGVIGDIEQIRLNNKRKAYAMKCGDNMIDIDEL